MTPEEKLIDFQKKLAILEDVRCLCPYRLNPVNLADAVKTGRLIPIEESYKSISRWDDVWSRKTSFAGLDDPKEWGTYQNCTDVTLYPPHDDKELARVKFAIWNGDNFHGNRTTLRWSSEFEIKDPDLFLSFYNVVDRAFERHLDREYDHYLEEQKSQWKAQRMSYLLELGNSNTEDPLAQHTPRKTVSPESR